MSPFRTGVAVLYDPPMSSVPAMSEAVMDAVERYWGYDTLRPMQAEAIAAGIDKRDALVVLPTGGGKSLCYQVPPLVDERLDIVVSPLISLMKDQVDGLRQIDYPAGALHSGMSAVERGEVYDALRERRYRLLFVSPERLVTRVFQELLEQLDIGAFAIDEAHCISHWGHDFRKEYRQLANLKRRNPGTSIHAFTATATPRVREDIVAQLGLDNPTVLVGTFDRPNLTYRIVPRVNRGAQIVEIIERHPKQAVIVYCITRRSTEEIAARLVEQGVNAAAYHAGMETNRRRRVHEQFSTERLDVVVATVAFGMGIDRSDVRCVIHAEMPKSIEHYQQETGRAGRDGLPAECVLLYSPADPLKWQRLLERPPDDPVAAEMPMSEREAESLHAQIALLRHMQGLCGTMECRHRALTRYFGQTYESDDCGSCDVCLGEVDSMPDSTVIAQKIISCVARLDQSFGVGQVVQVLRGADTEAVRRWRHESLSTYGLLPDIPEKQLTNLVYQLVDQDLLGRSAGDRPVVTFTEHSIAVLRGERDVHLVKPKAVAAKKSRGEAESWDGVDRDLYERLRELRRTLAQERGVPAYVIFGDRSLRDMASSKPTSMDEMAQIHGVGVKKLAEFGQTFIDVVRG